MEDTIFHKIIRREAPAIIVYEDDDTLAFLSTRPDAPGHTLVIPKKEARNIFDLDESSLAALLKTAQKIANALRTAVGAEGVNLIMNNEPVAGQAVFYAHLHVIPRRTGDGINYDGPAKTYADGEADVVAEKVRAALA